MKTHPVKRSTISLLSLLLMPTLLWPQSNFTHRRENGLSFTCGSAWNADLSSMAAAATFSLLGRLDLGVSRRILTIPHQTKDNEMSALVTLYLMRAEKTRLFLGVTYRHTKDILEETFSYSTSFYYGPMVSTSKQLRSINSFGISLGMLPPELNELSLMPSLNFAMSFPASQIDETPFAMIATDLSLLVPILESSDIVPSLQYAYEAKMHNFGIRIGYLQKFHF
jgi:hypothetical protein